MNHLYDTHYHLDLQKDRQSAIQEIEENHIYTIAVTNLPDLYRKEVIEVSSKYVRIALGFHPELIHEYRTQIPLMWDLLPNARYVGEVGLDFSDESFKKEQVAFFSELVERCKDDRNKIVSIHSRRAVKTVLDIIGKEFKFKPILHWFTGTDEELRGALDRGFYFSINPAMIKSKRFMQLLPLIPQERLLLETDSPFVNVPGTYANSLQSLVQSLAYYGINDLWDVFKTLLDG